MYREPEIEITRFEAKDVDTVEVSVGNFPGNPDINYGDF